MLIPKENRKLIHQELFNHGVLVAKKDYNAPKHETIPVPNLHVIKACQSLKSRGYVTEQFNWQYYYYFLTDAGILYLRNYLHLPESVVPATCVAKAIGRPSRPFGSSEKSFSDKPRRSEGGYRRIDDSESSKKSGFAPSSKPEFGRSSANN